MIFKDIMKYPEKVRQLRSISRKEIPIMLKNGSLSSTEIASKIKTKYISLCDNEIKCACGKNSSNRPEWQHQIKWGILDLKYQKKIKFSEIDGKYSL